MALSRRFGSEFTDPFMELNMSPFNNDPFFNRRTMIDPWSMMRGMSGGEELFSPRVDVWDTGSAIRVHADLPGVPKENVSVEIVNGNLQIQGETSKDSEYETFDSRVRERRCGNTILSDFR
jgi:HSP20 family protein